MPRRTQVLSLPCIPFPPQRRGTDGGIRTHTVHGLNVPPLPGVGLRRCSAAPRSRTAPRDRIRVGRSTGSCAAADGTGPRDRTVLVRFVRARPSPEGEPSVVRDPGIEPGQSCARGTRPTLDHVSVGSPSANRTRIAGVKGRHAAVAPPGNGRHAASRTLAVRRMRAPSFRTSWRLVAALSSRVELENRASEARRLIHRREQVAPLDRIERSQPRFVFSEPEIHRQGHGTP